MCHRRCLLVAYAAVCLLLLLPSCHLQCMGLKAVQLPQVIAALHSPQHAALHEIVPSPRRAISTLGDPGAAAGDVLTALMAVAVTAAWGVLATADMVGSGCIEALAARLRMSPVDHAKRGDDRRCIPFTSQLLG